MSWLEWALSGLGVASYVLGRVHGKKAATAKAVADEVSAVLPVAVDPNAAKRGASAGKAAYDAGKNAGPPKV